ncbi:class I SAM-dependent methyltransferase [Leifsonia shinshuensis]|uniref:Class I SAM-dependent methyltransferase n=1 Tax=Leifsonia shinshuensis TaxID=150026 RepID=A0A7G6Y9D0_9MICO|nr:class I SAM-dependent methyltransferase [Leifsonia shinshuensis]QNE35095.1 class I SAM-dependent methyltransferase [Leifsonia shinshuensis]
MSWPRVGRRVLALALLVVVLVTVAGSILAVVLQTDAWLTAALAVDLVVVGAVLTRSQHNLANELAQRQVERDSRLEAALAGLSAVVAEHVAYEPGKPLDLLRRDVQRDVSAMLALSRLLPDAGAVPAPGGWAATPETLLALVGRILDAEDIDTVVECGSGTSSVWIALALAQRGSGRLISLENSPEYADATRTALDRLGLSAWVDVRVAPLETVSLDGEDVLWYSPEALGGIDDVSVLFVDGPPAHFGERMRYPAVPLLADRLADGGWVLLDDVDRPDEQEIEADWLARPWSGATLRRVSATDRAAVLEVERASVNADV